MFRPPSVAPPGKGLYLVDELERGVAGRSGDATMVVPGEYLDVVIVKN